MWHQFTLHKTVSYSSSAISYASIIYISKIHFAPNIFWHCRTFINRFLWVSPIYIRPYLWNLVWISSGYVYFKIFYPAKENNLSVFKWHFYRVSIWFYSSYWSTGISGNCPLYSFNVKKYKAIVSIYYFLCYHFPVPPLVESFVFPSLLLLQPFPV